METDADITFIGRLLDQFSFSRVAVAEGVPEDMRAAGVGSDGWVDWNVIPSTLSRSDVAALEREYGIELPPIFRAYLLARFHLFDQVHANRHDGQLVFMTCVPSRDPLAPLRGILNGWRPLVTADYTPFAEWGDGWGPMCFDGASRTADGDCPVVWMDHERLHALGKDALASRTQLSTWAQPLYPSCRAFLEDVFSNAS